MKKEYSMKVSKIEEKTVSSKNVVDETVYTLKATQSKGTAIMKLSDETPFEGLIYGSEVKITINNDQRTLPKLNK